VDWDSSVDIATRYGLDGPGTESRCGVKFSAPVQTGPGAHPASYTMGTVSFPGVKRPGRGADHPPPFSAEVKEVIPLLSLWAFVAGFFRDLFLYLLPDGSMVDWALRPVSPVGFGDRTEHCRRDDRGREKVT
jgi:hypothetical protein